MHNILPYMSKLDLRISFISEYEARVEEERKLVSIFSGWLSVSSI